MTVKKGAAKAKKAEKKAIKKARKGEKVNGEL